MWTPDVYQGAPTTVTAFMSVGTKAAAFVALIRVLAALPTAEQPWLLALAILAVLTMTLGNLAALRQTSLKRMLAYSSIAHAGYILIGLAAGNQKGIEGALYYLLAYTFMTLGAFAVVLAVQRREENDVSIERLHGLAQRQPVLAVLMAIFMFSLAGIPPLAGFFAKLYVFSGAVEAGLTWLAVIGVINSAIGALLLPARHRLDLYGRSGRRCRPRAEAALARHGDRRDRGAGHGGAGAVAVAVAPGHHTRGQHAGVAIRRERSSTHLRPATEQALRASCFLGPSCDLSLVSKLH